MGTYFSGTWSINPPADGASVNASGEVTLDAGSTLASGAQITVVYTNGECSTTHILIVSSVGNVEPFGNIHFCVGDEIEPITPEYDDNVTDWAFYLSTQTAPTAGQGQPNFEIYGTLTAANNGQIWMVLPFNGTEAGVASVFATLVQNQDFLFTIEPESSASSPIFACLNDVVQLNPATDQIYVGTAPVYTWNNLSGTAFLPTNIATAGTANFTVTGEITPSPINILAPHARYCPTDVTIYYAVAELDVAKGNWTETLCLGESTILTLINNNAVPTGATLQTRWFAQVGTGTENLIAGNNNLLSLNVANIQETTAYRIEISIVDANGNPVCEMNDILHTIVVPVFEMSIESNSFNNGFCVGETMTLTAVGTGGTSFQWFKDGTPIVGENSLVFTKTFAEGDEGTYTFRTTNGDCFDEISITINANAMFSFNVPSSAIVTCTDASPMVLTATNVPSDAINPTFGWSVNGGAAVTANPFNFPINIAREGEITVTGSADNYCQATRNIEFTIVDLSLSFVSPPTNFCLGGEPVTIAVNVNGEVFDGISYEILWERQQQGGAWISEGNGTEISVSPSVTTAYRATIIVRNAQNTAICSRQTQPHTLNVIDLGMGNTQYPVICENAMLSLEGESTGGVQGAWFDVNRTMIQAWSAFPAARFLTNQFPTANTTYYFIARNGACEAEQQFDVTVKPIVRFEAMPAQISTCKGQVVPINTVTTVPPQGTIPVNFNWSVDGAFVSSGASFQFSAQTVRSGQISVFAPETATHCASAIQQIPYMVNEIDITLIDWPATFCPGESITLRAELQERPQNNIPTYVWFENGVRISSGMGTNAVETFRPATDAVFRLEVSTQACPEPVSQQRTISIVKTGITLPADTTICPGEEILIIAIPEAQNDFSIQWFKQRESDLEPIPMPQTGIFFRDRPEEQTKYTAVFESAGCLNAESFDVFMHSVPRIVGIEETQPRHVMFFVDSGTQPYEFAVNQQTYFTFSNESERLPLGTNIVFVRDYNRCQTSMPFTIAEPKLEFPPFFTPNGILEINRTWSVRGLELYEEIELLIFDRYGKELARMTQGNNAKWDGTYLGKPMPSTDYWYLLQIRETGREFIGNFTLIR